MLPATFSPRSTTKLHEQMQNALVQAKAALRETAEARVRPVVRDASGGHTFGKPRLTALGAASVPLPGLFSHDRSKAVAGSFAAAALLTPVRQIVYAFPSAIFLGGGAGPGVRSAITRTWQQCSGMRLKPSSTSMDTALLLPRDLGARSPWTRRARA